MNYNEIIRQMHLLIDEKFANDPMHANILNTKQTVLGIRTPALRGFVKSLCKNVKLNMILPLKDNSWEETLVAGMSLAYINDINIVFAELERFCARIDNWATCDQVCSSLKIFKKDKGNLFFENFIHLCYVQDQWTARVGIVMLMLYYLKPECIDKVFVAIQNLKNHTYYVDMAVAWLISYAIIKFPTETTALLSNKTLAKFVQNKAISKIRDSYRVDQKLKDQVVNFRIK